MTKARSTATMLSIAAIAAAIALGILAAPAVAAVKHVDGTVASKDSSARTFRITTQGGSRLTFKVNSKTVFERIAGGFGGLRKGLAVEVDYVMTGGTRLARQVETQGGGGSGGGGGDDHGSHGGDDGPNHT